MPHLLPAIIVALSLAGVAHTRTDCSLAITTVKFEYTTGEYAGCSGQIKTASCSGDCYSAMEPRVYLKKYATIGVSNYMHSIKMDNVYYDPPATIKSR